MRLRDDLELSVLAEFGDPVLAEAVGIAWQQSFELLCNIMGMDPKPFDDLNDHLDRIGDQ